MSSENSALHATIIEIDAATFNPRAFNTPSQMFDD